MCVGYYLPPWTILTRADTYQQTWPQNTPFGLPAAKGSSHSRLPSDKSRIDFCPSMHWLYWVNLRRGPWLLVPGNYPGSLLQKNATKSVSRGSQRHPKTENIDGVTWHELARVSPPSWDSPSPKLRPRCPAAPSLFKSARNLAAGEPQRLPWSQSTGK